MDRSQVLDAMGQLHVYDMRTAYNDIIVTAVNPIDPHSLSGRSFLHDIGYDLH